MYRLNKNMIYTISININLFHLTIFIFLLLIRKTAIRKRVIFFFCTPFAFFIKRKRTIIAKQKCKIIKKHLNFMLFFRIFFSFILSTYKKNIRHDINTYIRCIHQIVLIPNISFFLPNKKGKRFKKSGK